MRPSRGSGCRTLVQTYHKGSCPAGSRPFRLLSSLSAIYTVVGIVDIRLGANHVQVNLISDLIEGSLFSSQFTYYRYVNWAFFKLNFFEKFILYIILVL